MPARLFLAALQDVWSSQDSLDPSFCCPATHNHLRDLPLAIAVINHRLIPLKMILHSHPPQLCTVHPKTFHRPSTMQPKTKQKRHGPKHKRAEKEDIQHQCLTPRSSIAIPQLKAPPPSPRLDRENMGRRKPKKDKTGWVVAAPGTTIRKARNRNIEIPPASSQSSFFYTRKPARRPVFCLPCASRRLPFAGKEEKKGAGILSNKKFTPSLRDIGEEPEGSRAADRPTKAPFRLPLLACGDTATL